MVRAMGIGYVLTTEPLDVRGARTVVTFCAGPWGRLIAYEETDLRTLHGWTKPFLSSPRGPLSPGLLYGIPTLPIPVPPKIIDPPPEGMVAIALVRVAAGKARAVADNLDPELVSGAVRLVTPYSHLLLDFTGDDEADLIRRIDDTVDLAQIEDVQVGLALAEDVVRLDATST
ncbi:MAG: hypothetical protein QOJ92_539 [Frankiales bacterium]|jgi:hypothetical protein|nr:hypothetical protein [Frankiales bacterium]